MIINKDEILDAADLVEIIGDHTTLKRRGAGVYEGLCPFHDEKTPSFKVSPDRGDRGIFKCYGCGVGGNDAASFLMKKENLLFPEALTALAARYRIPLEQSGNPVDIAKEREVRDKKVELLNVMRDISAMYLDNRGITYAADNTVELAGKIYTKDTIEKWGISLAPNKLISDSSIKDKAQLADDLGIILPSKRGKGYFDFFAGRLLFPIVTGIDHTGAWKVAGYSARIMDNSKKNAPKYLNSRESIIYDKSKVLFGYAHNQKSIRDNETAILVEGQTDVILMDQNGCSNVVAGSSKNFTLDQAKILSRDANKVIIMLDGPKKGHPNPDKADELLAAEKIVDIIVKAQMEPLIYLLGEGEDPADFAVKHGTDTYHLIHEDAECALSWKIKRIADGGGAHNLSRAITEAAEIISTIRNKVLRDHYVKIISQAIEHPVNILKAEVKQILSDAKSTEIKLSAEQEEQKRKFSIYRSGKCYKDWNDNKISDFILTPLFLIREKDRSDRVFMITNEEGDTEYLIIDQKDLISLSAFRVHIEKLGKYVFFGKDESFIRMRQLCYANVPKAFPIRTLGYHKLGFYAFANGILDTEGHFQPVDAHGIVTVTKDKKEIRFFLPEHSELKESMDTDEPNQSELLDKFIYVENKGCHPNFSAWSQEFKEIMEHRGILPVAFYFATIFRDIIFNRYNFFPILNLFGQKSSGKTFSSRCLASLFGKPLFGTHSVTTTTSAFFRNVAQIRNAVRIYEEYSEKVPERFQEGFKLFYDGFGRDLAKMNQTHETRKVPVNSTVCLTGQVLPSQDPALLERMLTEYHVSIDKSEKEKERAFRFEELAKTGGFSKYISEIHALRPFFKENFNDKVTEVSDFFQQSLTGTRRPNTRVMHNYSIVTAAYMLIASKIKLPWSISEVYDKMMERMVDQSLAVEGAQELSDWWSLIITLIGRAYASYHDDKLIYTRSHFAVKERTDVRIINPKDYKNNIDIALEDSPRKLLFIKMNASYQAYRELAGKTKIDRILPRKTLEYYLQTSKAYIGEARSVRLRGSENPCKVWVFDTEFIPDGSELDFSSYIDNRNSETPEGTPSQDPFSQPEIFNAPKPSSNPADYD